MSWQHYLLLLVAAVVAGAVNAVAGGGTLLTFPSLLWAGQLEIVANATSTVAIWPGALSSLWAYGTEFASSRKEIVLLAVPSLLGGVAGAVLLLHTDNATFAALVPYLILLATLLFMAQEPLARWQRRRAERTGVVVAAVGATAGLSGNGGCTPGCGMPATMPRWAAVLAFQLLVGVYGGYFGAGIGILMLAAFGFLGFTNIHHMNALKNLNAVCINGIASVLFVARGLVDWRLALLMATGTIIGGYAGAGTARRVGQKNVRRTIVVIGFALSAWLLARQMGWSY